MAARRLLDGPTPAHVTRSPPPPSAPPCTTSESPSPPAAQADAAFRFALLGTQQPRWHDIVAEKTDFSAITERIVQRAVAAGRLREDFRAEDFVLIARGAMANMTDTKDWRRYVSLLLDGIRVPAP